MVAAHGRHYDIELAGGERVRGFPRGKKSIYACGDEVEVQRISANQVQILTNLPRRSLLYRSDAYREKLIAANATQAVLVVATEPSFSVELLSRILVAAESQELRSLIVLNKIDLADRVPAARAQLAPLAALSYPLVEISARQDATPLLPHLAGQVSVIVGQSGMGKSSLVNALVPSAQAATREISTVLDSGKHSTTHARLYRLSEDAALIDCPGLQEFGLAHLPAGAIEQGFIELRPYLGKCRFRDCHHQAEPDCAIKEAVALGKVDAQRLLHFQRLTAGRPKLKFQPFGSHGGAQVGRRY